MEGKFSSAAAFPGNPSYEKLTERADPLYSRQDDIRSPFARDYTRVLHSLAYRRMKHKTQVFFNAAHNDHICTRIEHVAHVESVSNNIAKRLGLNEDLTNAIAIAHDLGHAPFGHEGERALSELTMEYLGRSFWHEKNGVHFVDDVELLRDNENNLRNLSLTYGVRDGIISHCGEIDQNGLLPRHDLFDLSRFQKAGQYQAASWEGCVVKLADKFAYIGRDIEDASRLGYFSETQKKQLREMAQIHNQKAINTTVIMHNMIIDLCENSSVEKGLLLSRAMSEQLDSLKRFNYEAIYHNKRLEPYKEYSRLVIRQIFRILFSCYRGDATIREMEKHGFYRRNLVMEFGKWISRYCDDEIIPECFRDITGQCRNKKIYGYLDNETIYIQAIIDYIAGMTDIYAVETFNELLAC
ncbi:MAG: HD domain-containing protein [Eubacterium sp.]|nr:HD domain-containing protein [Eubacterium sp.]